MLDEKNLSDVLASLKKMKQDGDKSALINPDGPAAALIIQSMKREFEDLDVYTECVEILLDKSVKVIEDLMAEFVGPCEKNFSSAVQAQQFLDAKEMALDMMSATYIGKM